MSDRPVVVQPGVARPVSWILLAVAAVVIFLIGLVIGALSQHSSGAHVTATATTTITETAPTAQAPIAGTATGGLSQFGDGVYQVGVDIAAGNYHTEGGPDCYWERLSALSGGFSGIITNGEPTGPATVRVQSSDKGFGVHGGCTWTAVP